MNRVILLGNVGKEPEFKAGATSLLKFSLATKEVYYDAQKVKQEKTSWHSVTLFGKQADSLKAFIAKGSMLLVEGKIRYSDSEKDGVKKYYTDIVADKIEFAGGRKNESNAGGSFGATESIQNDSDIPF